MVDMQFNCATPWAKKLSSGKCRAIELAKKLTSETSNTPKNSCMPSPMFEAPLSPASSTSSDDSANLVTFLDEALTVPR